MKSSRNLIPCYFWTKDHEIYWNVIFNRVQKLRPWDQTPAIVMIDGWQKIKNVESACKLKRIGKLTIYNRECPLTKISLMIIKRKKKKRLRF